MTYCFAWKSNNEIYIVADSLTSTKSEFVSTENTTLSSVGELYGEYNSHFIAETDTKISVKNNIVIAYAGKDIEIFEDVKRYLNEMVDCLTIEQILEYLPDILIDSELILAVKSNNVRLYYLNTSGFREVENNIAIGSGSKIPDLNYLMQDFMVTYPNPNYDPRKKLTAATAYLQMISIKNNFLNSGVGGTFCGVCIHNEIEWNDDLLYFFYDEKFENKKLVNVIVRKNSIITGSDFTGLTKLFKQNKMDEVRFRKMSRFVHKAITSYVPRYIVFYSFEYNNIYFCDIYKYTHTALIRIFQRRGKIAAKTELFTSPFLLENFLLKYRNDEKFIIPFNYLDTSPVEYMSREQLIESVDNIWEVEYEYDYFDYPIDKIQINISNIERYFKFSLYEYENLIVVNNDYFESKIVELRNFYQGLNIQFDSAKILKGICDFLKSEWGIDKFEILIFSNKYQFFSEKIDGLELILIKNSREFGLIVNKLLHNYYTNEKYFHLNKIFIVDDSPHLNKLFEFLPEYNKNKEEADIFMIKNQNSESRVMHAPFYYNTDILFSQIAGLSYEALGLWSPSEYTKDELIEIQEYLNEQIENSKM